MKNLFVIGALLACCHAHAASTAPHPPARLADGEACIPALPDSALGRGKSGTTGLLLRVGADGAVTGAKITGSSGHADLDQATIIAASKCKFAPKLRNGIAIASSVVFTHIWARAASPTVPGLTAPAARKPCPRMAYPAASLAAGEQGTVHMSFLIDVDGSVAERNVVRSSGFAALDQATLEGMEKCEFTPAISNGKPVRSLLSFSYAWTLN